MEWVWLAWFLFVVVSFAALEGYALAYKKPTLSQCVWKLSKGWPPLPWLVGNVTGGLAVHFWWPMCF